MAGKRETILILTFLTITACRPEGDMAELSITVNPEVSYIYWDEEMGMFACTARVKIEERENVGVTFLKEEVEYVDIESGEVFKSFTYDKDEIKDFYGSNYLPGGAWVEFEITDFVDPVDPKNFYIVDTLYCVDDKDNYFTESVTRTCLSQ